MNLAVIGFGNAGGKIADRLLAFERETGRSLSAFAMAVNAAAIDLEKLEEIPEAKRLLIGQTHEQVKGRGAGADPELGAEVTRQDLNEIERALDGVPLHAVDGFLVVAGLGGGTGSGGAPVLAERLRETYEEPVYGLGVMPGSAEGGRASLNAARSLQSFTNATDNLMLFDNDAWRSTDDSIEGGYQRTNQELARRFVTLLAAGEIDGSQVSESAMDSSDIRRTLSTGGVSTIAYSEATVERETRKSQGLLGRLSTNGHDEQESENSDLPMKIHGLVRKAVQSRLTCPADVSSAERALIVISGPPREFSQKGIQRARQWLEQETQSVEVLAGDDPRQDADHLSACVLLSNVTDVPRVDQLQEQAVGAQDSIDDQAATREDEIDELITDDQNRLDPV
ncbi:Cell division GTPase FtsZ [Halomicrobium zhouii]|uniref:Tubulin-like protein CetZ n=1 Tax=Halomicrobium zhouii TaxID=767519 RepID=A0A1I6KYY1_9EURY|nr:tubulin/FtsZ family protein [Halomicrobium zhouii]SFR96432.1 Cell division GTPase FtsZ [Halomicrobium zhouii]